MAISTRTRFAVLQRDDFTCRYCGHSAPDVKLHVDHIVPASAGGSDDRNNLVTACAPCNLGKSDLPTREKVLRYARGAEVRLVGAGPPWRTCRHCALTFDASHDGAGRPVEDIESCESCDGLAQRAWTAGYEAGARRNGGRV